jgi:hypothetical protein
MSSRIFKDRAQNRICQIFGSGQRGLLAAPAGAVRKELGGKIIRWDKIPRHNFFGNEAVRHNEVMLKSFEMSWFKKLETNLFAQNIPLRGIETIFHSLAEH